MRVFVTGATGFIGGVVVPELLRAGHQVLGLSRSAQSDHALAAMGAEAHRGDLNDLDSLRRGEIDYVTLTSSNIARALIQRLDQRDTLEPIVPAHAALQRRSAVDE